MLKNRFAFLPLPMARILAVGVVISLIIGLKGHFAGADAPALEWLLRPVAALTSFFSGISFVSLDSAGYYNADRNVLIAPACSGLNFFLILLATGSCLAVWALPSPARCLLWFPAIAMSAYGIGLFVNTLRILLAIFLYARNFSIGPFTPDRIHRIEGIVIYTLFLWGFTVVLSGLLRKASARNAPERETAAIFSSGNIFPAIFSLGCYFLFTLAIPLANGAARKSPELFMEHGLTVFFIGSAIILGGFAVFRKKSVGKHPSLS